MGIHEDILQLEMKIHQLRVDYDQYFAGVNKIPPLKLQEEVQKVVRKYSGVQIHNTALAFKFKSLVGRYTTYNNLWSRTMRQLEEGTFVRGQGRRAQLKTAVKAAAVHEESAAEKLYKEYVAAKKSLHQNSDDIKVKGLNDLIEKQTAQIKSKYKCSGVDYKVVVEGGKAKIKAVPKK